MEPFDIAEALTALSHTNVTGVKEASVLFHLANAPATSADVIILTNGKPKSTRMRLHDLREKKLVKFCHQTKQYGLTIEGKKLVKKVTK